MSLVSLKKLVSPPSKRSGLPDGGGWHSVENRLGRELPVDYKEIISTYGTGALDNFLWVLNPFSQNVNLNLIDEGLKRLNAQRQFSVASGAQTPYALYPDANGVFPWGITDNGDVLYWLCEGPASAWTIVVCDGRAARWQEYKLSTSQFLTAVLAKDLVVDVFPDDFPSESPEFTTVD